MKTGGRGSRGFARNILSNWGAYAFSAAVAFVLSPFVVHSLGDSRYGVWVLLASLVGNLGLLDLGVRSAVGRFIAHFHAGGDQESANRLYAAGLRIFTLAGAVAVLISAGMALLVESMFKVPPEYVRTAQIVVLLGGLNIAVSLLSGLYSGVLFGLERFDLANGLEIVVGALRAIAIVVALRAGYGLIALSLVQLSASALRGGASIYLCRRLYSQLRLAARAWDWEFIRLIFSFGLSAALLNAASTLMLSSDSLVLGALLPVGMITYFNIAASLSEYARSVVSGISTTVTPRVSAIQASGDAMDLQSAVMTTSRLTTAVVLPMAATFLVRGSSFIGLWMGPRYADLSGHVLQILALALWTIAGYQVAGAAIMGVGKHRGLVPIFIAEAACNIGLSIVLVRAYGVIGTAIGTLIPRLIVSAIIGPWYVCRETGLPLRTFWVGAFIQPTIAIAPFAIASYCIDRFWPATNLVMYFAQVGLLLPVAAIGYWMLCLSGSERDRLGRAFVLARRTAARQS